MNKLKEIAQSNIFWKLGEGKVSFWFHDWSPLGPLHHFALNPEACQGLVNDYITPQGWNWDKMYENLPDLVVTKLRATHFTDISIRIWKLTPNGEFTTKSIWELIRTIKDVKDPLKLPWHNRISPAISIFWWKTLS